MMCGWRAKFFVGDEEPMQLNLSVLQAGTEIRSFTFGCVGLLLLPETGKESEGGYEAENIHPLEIGASTYPGVERDA